jgi:hypothetical protein
MTDQRERDGPAGSEAVLLHKTAGTSDVDGKQPQRGGLEERVVSDNPERDGEEEQPVLDVTVRRTEPSSSSWSEENPAAEQVSSADEKAALRLHERKLQDQDGIDDYREAEEISPVDEKRTANPNSSWPNEKQQLPDPLNSAPPQQEPFKDAEIVTLRFKKNRWGRYIPIPEQKLRNNLLGAVGYLEFANALDFAANVWNSIPVPTFAAALMGLGGSIAIILSFFALNDGIKAWRNVKLLRGERAHLKSVVRDEEMAARGVVDGYDVDVKIEVNRRELGQEIVDRLAMDVFMGFSSLVVGVGTLLAIAGANPRIYHASNLLSGYIGNSPSAFWGLGNTLWSAYLFRRARRHYVIGTRDLHHEVVKARLKRRTNAVRIHSFIMGLATLVSAPCGLITATMWQGYPPLIPCILLAKWGNVIWRRRLGYTRFPISAASPSVLPSDLIRELEWTIGLQEALLKAKKSKEVVDVNAYRGKDSITTFMSKVGLLESLCNRLLQSGVIQPSANGKDVFQLDQLDIEKYEATVPTFAQTCSELLQEKGLRALAYRERHSLELLGASVYDAAVRRKESISRLETTRG